MRITGRSRILFTLGCPVAHIVGTDILNRYLADRGIDAAIVPLQIEPQRLGEMVASIRTIANVAGFAVTIPHKIAILPHLDTTGPRGQQVGAVNFVRRDADGSLHGENVDGLGFVGGLLSSGVTVKGARILQAGAGGAGRAIAFALAEAGASRITITNRSPQKAHDLAEAVRRAYPTCEARAGEADPADCDIAVNTTSVGTGAGDPSPIDASRLRPDAVAAEVIMAPEWTPFLAAASSRGCAIVPGKAMLQAQLREACDHIGLG